MQRLFTFILIALFTILPIVIDFYLSINKHYPFIWSLFLIPIILTIVKYPKWKVTILSVLFFSSLKYSVEFIQHINLTYEEGLTLFLSSVVNWLVIITIASFVIKYNKLYEELKNLTLIDHLTELYNRRYFDMYFEKEYPLLVEKKSNLCLILLDIDHFKKINDNYGHVYGDKVLIRLSKIIKRSLRNTDTVVRMGGEEFVIILPETNIKTAVRIAQNVRENVANSKFFYKGERIVVTISLGVAKYNNQSLVELLEEADNALYQAKDRGRNQVIAY